jgi:peptide/nickel transport system substrate-binding protein
VSVRRAALLVPIALVLFACKPAEKEAPTTSATETTPILSSGPTDGGTLYRRFESDITSLNPLLVTTTYEKNVLSYIHEPLLDLAKDHKLAPALAERWTVSPDGKSYTFYLDRRARWSDGKQVQASDVVFTLKKIVDPKSQSPQLAGLFNGLDANATRAVNATTVQVVFTAPRASQLLAFNVPIIPEHVYSKGNFLRDFNRKALGSGPYTLKAAKAGESITLERRKDYWRTNPHIQTIVFRLIEDDATAFNALLKGEVDETRVTSDQWKNSKDQTAVTEKIDLRRFYPLSYSFIPWNTKDEMLSDKRVRTALAMCFDRRSMINSLFYGTARIVTGPYTPDHPAYNPKVKPIEFDLDKAAKLLKEAGWVDTNKDNLLDRAGRPLSVEILIPSGSTISASMSQAFQQSAGKIGVDVKVTPLDASVMFNRLFEGKYQGAFVTWDLDLDPDLFTTFHSSQMSPTGQNFAFYSNKQVDDLIVAARQELDDEKRLELYQQLHALLAEEQPYMWLLQVSTKWGINRRVQNVEEAEGLGLFLWNPGPLEWWLGQPTGKSVSVPR